MEWTRDKAILNGGPRVEQIIDALLGREVRVTKQMIRDGHKKDCKSCPVALAILTVIPGAEVKADYWMIQVDDCVRFNVPDAVERFMGRFDYTRNRESMRGIRFTLTELQAFYCQPKEYERAT